MTAVLCVLCGEILVGTEERSFKQCGCSNQTFIESAGDDTFTYGGQDLYMIVTGLWNKDSKTFEEDEIYKGVISENPNLSSKRTTH